MLKFRGTVWAHAPKEGGDSPHFRLSDLQFLWPPPILTTWGEYFRSLFFIGDFFISKKKKSIFPNSP